MRFKWEVSRNFLQYSKFILPVGLVAVLATVLGVGWYTQPDRFVRGYEPVQPIPYSHALHPGTSGYRASTAIQVLQDSPCRHSGGRSA